MKFKDLFVPRYLHSDPKVRLNFVQNCNDSKLLKSITQQDSDDTVRRAAEERMQMLASGQYQGA